MADGVVRTLRLSRSGQINSRALTGRILHLLQISTDVAHQLETYRAAVADSDRLSAQCGIERLACKLRQVDQERIKLSLPREKESDKLLQLRVPVLIHVMGIIMQELVAQRDLPQRRAPELRADFTSARGLLHATRKCGCERVGPGETAKIGKE